MTVLAAIAACGSHARAKTGHSTAPGQSEGADPGDVDAGTLALDGGTGVGDDLGSEGAGDDIEEEIGDDSPGDATAVDVTITGSPAGAPCALDDDCASGMCVANVCTDATSCLTLLQERPGLSDREYEIDPDGPDAGGAPFDVYCDMTTDGGGWTMLPLRFGDPTYWSITTTPNSCLSIDLQDNAGNYLQHQNLSAGDLAYAHLTFVPPIPLSSVRLVDFVHTNGGSQNTMDFVIGAVTTTMTPNLEAWYFVDPSTLMPVGYTFSTPGSCPLPYELYLQVTCSRDYATMLSPVPTQPFPFSETIALSSSVPNLEMVLVQGCFSIPVDPVGDCELFRIANPPAADGVWNTGIAVR